MGIDASDLTPSPFPWWKGDSGYRLLSRELPHQVVHEQLSQSQQGLSAALHERVFMALQQPQQPERIRRSDYDVR